LIIYINLPDYSSVAVIGSAIIMEGDKRYLVSEGERQGFREKGFVKLRGILKGGELQAFRQLMNQTVEKVASQGDKQDRIDDYSNIFTQVTNLWRV
jgi:hypothetical protein